MSKQAQPEMTRRLVPALFAGLLVWAQRAPFVQPVTAGQATRQTGILRAAAKTVAEIEPNWRFISATCNFRGPLLPEQVGIECGTWEPLQAPAAAAAINVTLHIVSNAQAASRWINRAKREGSRANGWTFADYDLADGARMATYQDGKQVTIDVRKGRILMIVRARTKSDAERFATYLVSAVSVER